MSSAVQKKSAQTRSATLDLGDQQIELPTLVGTEDERAIDISKLRARPATSPSTKVT